MNIRKAVIAVSIATALAGCHSNKPNVRVEHAGEAESKSMKFDVAQPKVDYVLCDKCEKRTRKIIDTEQVEVINEPVVETRPVVIEEPVVTQLQQVKQEYVVHFDFDKSTTNKQETKQLVQFIKSVNKNGEFLIQVNGNADPVGKLAYNKKLSLKRAGFVKYVMVKAGINAAKIKTSIEQPCCQGSVKDNALAQSQKRKATINIVYGEINGSN